MDKKAMYKLSYGLFVLTAKEGNKDSGCIINTAIQAASTPNQMSICVNKANYTHDMIMRTGAFTVSVLSQRATFDIFKHFGFQSGRDVDKFADFTDYSRGINDILYVTKGTNAFISVKVDQTQDLGSHTMFIGEITDMEVLSPDSSVTYEYYMNNIKPKPQAVGTTEKGETIWRCIICGYEYVGEDLPADFICPLCKHPASDFEKVVKAPAKEAKAAEAKEEKTAKKSIWRCNLCGYEYEGEEIPQDYLCPLCGQAASAFVKVEPEAEKSTWRCSICGYEYEGEELPEDYVCPLCSQPASAFVKVE